jgi:F0F1-type ATP synthase assembly protein I
MAPTVEKPGEYRLQRTFRLTLAVFIGQVGCLTSFFLIAALFGGIWLDSQFNTKPVFTIGLLIISIPITLVGMIWLVRKTTAKIQATKVNNTEQNEQEDNISG